MSSVYNNYDEAFNAAIDLSNLCKIDVGLEKAIEFNRKVYRIFMLPKKENRCGFELRCQVIIPNTPKSMPMKVKVKNEKSRI